MTARLYGRVYTQFWRSRDVARLTDRGRLAFLYLLTGPHSNAAGVMHLPVGYVAADLGWGIDVARAVLDELAGDNAGAHHDGAGQPLQNGSAYPSPRVPAGAVALRCPDTDWTLIPRYLHHNPPDNGNVGKAIARIASQVPPDAAVFPLLVNALRDVAGRLPAGFVDAMAARIVPPRPATRAALPPPAAQPLQNGIRNQEQEQDRDRVLPLRITPPVYLSTAPAAGPVQPVLPIVHDGARPSAAPKASSPKRRIPDGWNPALAIPADWARANCPAVDVAAEAARFTDWAVAGAKTYADWTATFRNWLRKAQERANDRRAPGVGHHHAGPVRPRGYVGPKPGLRMQGDID
jgi:hypothetical protein